MAVLGNLYMSLGSSRTCGSVGEYTVDSF